MQKTAIVKRSFPDLSAQSLQKSDSGKVFGLGFTYIQHQTDTMIANDQQQQLILGNYMDQMTNLLLSNNINERLYESKKGDGIRVVSQAMTLMTFSRLDSGRKRVIVLFLYQAKLILRYQQKTDRGFDFPILNLYSANLIGANLTGVDLTGALVTNKQLDQAKSLTGVIMPKGTRHS